MPKCPNCDRREIPVRDWLFFYGPTKCRACHTVVEHSPRVIKYGWRVNQLALIVLVIVAVIWKIDKKTAMGIFVLVFAVWQLFLYFSRPVPYVGEFVIGVGRAERLLAPVLWMLAVAYFAYMAYWVVSAH